MYRERKLEKILLKSLDRREITVILGARQTGKTTLLKKIYSDTNKQKCFIDLDIFENQSIFKSYSEVMRYLKFEGYEKNREFTLFIDEFHKVKDIGKILKNIYDNNPEIKIFATGSSSIEIISRMKESLAGRKRIYNLYPLSFKELLLFRDESLHKKFIHSDTYTIPTSAEKKLYEMIKEYCVFGGYPEVALERKRDEKKNIIRDIFDLFVEKDLINFLKTKNPQAAHNILKYVAINSGQIINHTDISNTCSVDINTLKKYLNILEKTFIIKNIPPFFTNKKKEIVKAPKIYFYDPGIRNYFLKNFAFFEDRSDTSFLLENYFFSQFIKKAAWDEDIKYWRDKNGREVDFITQKNNRIKAYEIKNKNVIKKRDISNLLFFRKTYPETELFLLNFNAVELSSEKINLLKYYEI